MKRRDFLNTTLLGSMGLTLPLHSCIGRHNVSSNGNASPEFKNLMNGLLKQWCDGMLRVQINKPELPELHGALLCPACNIIHGRCMDAVYPFFHMAQITGDKNYMEAGKAVFEWSKNVSMPDGSWTVVPDPKSWKGITVFGAIALAETLQYHGNLLDAETKTRWTGRLQKAAEYIYTTFTINFTNINYGFTAVYGLNLLGRVLDNPTYVARSKELANEVKNFLTEPNKLIFGEGKPSNLRSAKGLLPVDLGYNVEESLNNVVMYALEENDEELLGLLTESLKGHLEFMLPDGGWDNSWGTRQAKWSYWGSRTSDGCLPAFGLMATVNPAFGTAAYLNTKLLQQCTSAEFDLLSGGLHYTSHKVKPCVHHSFAHAKPLALLLDLGDKMPQIDNSTPLPRQIANGVKEFPEVATWLVARGQWRGTVTAYDWIYKEHVQQATGGSLSVLYHNKVGLLLTASMAKYILVEEYNQQPNPDQEDFAFTPRIETYSNGKWFTNLYDLEANVSHHDADNVIKFVVDTQLRDENREVLEGKASQYQLSYLFENELVEIRAKRAAGNDSSFPSSLVVPIVSPTGEEVVQVSPAQIEIIKKNGRVVIEANVPLRIKETEKPRIFNMVPGAEAVPIIIDFPSQSSGEVSCTIKVI